MPKPEGMIWDVAHSAVMSIDRSSLAPNHGSRAGRMSHTHRIGIIVLIGVTLY